MDGCEAVGNFIRDISARMNHRFVLKDFVGFLNWMPALNHQLAPYTRHAAPYCVYVKSNIAAFHRCIHCVNVLQRRCMREHTPFFAVCFHGIKEYHIPIVVEDSTVGVISVGCFRPGAKHDGQGRPAMLHDQYGFDEELLNISYNESTLPDAENLDGIAALYGLVAWQIGAMLKPTLSQHKLTISPPTVPSTAYEKIIKFIVLNYTDPELNVLKIGEACGYSPSSVSHIFHGNMHMNIRAYINQLRITLAQKLLRNGESVVDAAMESGFNSISYFSGTFKACVGISPLEYKKSRLNA